MDAKDIWKLSFEYRYVGMTQSVKIPKYEINAIYRLDGNSIYGYKLTPYKGILEDLGDRFLGSRDTQPKQELYYVFEKKEEL